MSDLREILFNVSEGFKAIDARLSHIELQHRDISEKLDNIVVALGTFHSDVEAMRDLNAEQHQRAAAENHRLPVESRTVTPFGATRRDQGVFVLVGG